MKKRFAEADNRMAVPVEKPATSMRTEVDFHYM